MKRVLIISPNFPPVNAADMHRVRQTLPWLKELGWEPVVLAVDEKYIEAYSEDQLLLKSFPEDIEVHKVKALDASKTRKFGLGSLGMRSYIYFRRKGDQLLKERPFDLVYFSTTMFHVMALGPRWKRKFGVPFILDFQDPWRSDFYLTRPASERPPKFFIAYNIDKYMEGRTVPRADGIISVSKGYCDTFLQRYPSMMEGQFRVIPFGANSYDFRIMEQYVRGTSVTLLPGKVNMVYVGRGGHDMRFALQIIFKALKKGLEEEPARFSHLHLWFIGTSYAAAGQGKKTVEQVAESCGVKEYVSEITDRLPYFDTLFLLKKADMLLVPGSSDVNYTASKIFPYVLAEKPLLAVFHRQSSVVGMLAGLQFGHVVAFGSHEGDRETPDTYKDACFLHLKNMLETQAQPVILDKKRFEPFTDRSRAEEQVSFFNQIINERVS